jgi:ribosomal protein L7/L12
MTKFMNMDKMVDVEEFIIIELEKAYNKEMAITLYKDVKQVSLIAATKYVESILENQEIVSKNEAMIIGVAEAYGKAKAIEEYQEAMNLSLEEATEYVENFLGIKSKKQKQSKASTTQEINSGVDDFVIKTFNKDGIFSALKSCMDVYGMSLIEAQKHVSKLTHKPNPLADAEIIKVYGNGQKLKAIKACVDLYGVGLDEAKKHVEGLISTIKPIKNADKKPIVSGNMKGCLLIAIIILIIVVFVSLCTGKESSDSMPKKGKIDSTNVDISSRSIAQYAIEKQLKAPSTANFPYEEQNVTIFKDSIVVVEGVVDAQNEFGAMLRGNYFVRIKFDNGLTDTKKYSILDARLEE